MKVAIIKREERSGLIVRLLECGHEQPETHGSKSGSAFEAFCRTCSARNARAAPRKPRPGLPADERNELQRLADELESVYAFPAGRAWGRADVLVRKLINGARRHSCRAEVQQP